MSEQGVLVVVAVLLVYVYWLGGRHGGKRE